jgi:hypothetical protein
MHSRFAAQRRCYCTAEAAFSGLTERCGHRPFLLACVRGRRDHTAAGAPRRRRRRLQMMVRTMPPLQMKAPRPLRALYRHSPAVCTTLQQSRSVTHDFNLATTRRTIDIPAASTRRVRREAAELHEPKAAGRMG